MFAMPELRGYSDEQVQSFIWQAKIRRGDAIWVLPMLAGLAAAGAWMLMVFGLAALIASRVGGSPAGWWPLTLFVAVTLFLGAFLALRRVLIARSLKNMLNKAACPYCDFSLVGLTITHETVQCPECGSRVVLHEHRLHREDIEIAPPPFAGAGPMGAYQEPAKTAHRTSAPAAKASRRA